MRYLSFLTFVIIALIACTEEEKILPAPEIYLDNKDGIYDMDRADTLIIQPKITYDYNATYWWKDSETNEIIQDSKDLIFIGQTFGLHKLRFSVSNTTSSDTADIKINVYDIVDFEDYKFDKDAEHSIGGPFAFKSYITFTTTGENNEANRNGFAMSKITKYPGNDSSNRFFCVQSKKGNDESDVFSVYKYLNTNEVGIQFTDNNNDGHTIKSLDINNTYEAYKRMYTESLFDRKEKVDYLRVLIHGHATDGTIISTSKAHYLANYQFESNTERFVQTDWQTIELEELGKVNAISFEIQSSKDITGDNVALSYFCIDNLKIMD